MRTKKGFTLVEILIVVVILGILAAIVIPQFTEASTDAKRSSLASDLQTARSQIELYKIQHSDALPGAASGTTFTEAMTLYTNAAGEHSATKSTSYPFGPYLQKIPTNPFNSASTVNTVTGTTAPIAGSSNGWNFNTDTGAFHAGQDVNMDDDIADSELQAASS